MSFAREQASPRREPYRYLVRYCALWRRSRVTSPSLAAGRCTSVQRERAEPPAHTDPPREARSMHLSSRGNTNTRQDGAHRIDDRADRYVSRNRSSFRCVIILSHTTSRPTFVARSFISLHMQWMYPHLFLHGGARLAPLPYVLGWRAALSRNSARHGTSAHTPPNLSPLSPAKYKSLVGVLEEAEEVGGRPQDEHGGGDDQGGAGLGNGHEVIRARDEQEDERLCSTRESKGRGRA